MCLLVRNSNRPAYMVHPRMPHKSHPSSHVQGAAVVLQVNDFRAAPTHGPHAYVCSSGNFTPASSYRMYELSLMLQLPLTDATHVPPRDEQPDSPPRGADDGSRMLTSSNESASETYRIDSCGASERSSVGEAAH